MRDIVIKMNYSRIDKNLEKIQVCKQCGQKFHSIFQMDICNACITSKTNKDNLKKDQICEKCGKIFHSTFIMKIGPCCNDSHIGVKNFTYEKNERFYKGQKVNEIIQKLDSGEYDVKDFPGWNKRFGRWCIQKIF